MAFLYITVHHPDQSCFGLPQYEIRGSQIYITVHHPDQSRFGLPQYEIR
jgi:hypothetical protein